MVDGVGKFLQTSDVTLYYELRGNTTGVPLFVLNGGPGRSHSSLLISPVWDELAQDRPLVLYDQRGTGRSTALKPGDSCTLADQLLDLEALRSHLEVEQVDVVGHSWGGYLGMAYTARYGQRVRRLILVASAAPRIQDTVTLFKEVFLEATERREQLRFAMRLGDQAALQAAERLYFSMLCYSPEKRDSYLALADPTDLRLDVAQMLTADLQRFDLTPELPKFRQLTLVITGRFDMNVAPSVAYKIHKTIPNSQFVVFEQSGHLPFFEEPEIFVQTVARFLADAEPQG
jgi:proline iminopeptidase